MKTTLWVLALSALVVLHFSAESEGADWTKTVINETPLPGACGVGTGDLNGSHYADVIVAAKDVGDRVVWYENPHPPPVPVFWAKHGVDSLADGAREIAVADIDRDDDLDIIVAVRDENIIVWYENSFISPTAAWPMYQVGSLLGPRGVVTAYVNADTLIDIVAGGMAESTVVWYEAPLDPASGAWVAHTVDDSLRGVKGVFAIDLDGDSDTDIVAAGRDCNDVVWYEHLGTEPPSWRKHFIDMDLQGAVSVWCGNLVGDERPEVAVTAKGACRVMVYEQPDEVGDMWTPTVIDTFLLEACPIHAADFDLDGHTDIAAAGRAAQTVAWYKSPGLAGRAWRKTVIDASAGSCMGLTTADLDSDGYTDIVATSTEGEVIWYRNDIAAGVTDSRSTHPGGRERVWPNPSRDDVVISLSAPGTSVSARVSIYDTEGRLVWRSAPVSPVDGIVSVNWDGKTGGGVDVPPGVYFYHIKHSEGTSAGKLVRLR